MEKAVITTTAATAPAGRRPVPLLEVRMLGGLSDRIPEDVGAGGGPLEAVLAKQRQHGFTEPALGWPAAPGTHPEMLLVQLERPLEMPAATFVATRIAAAGQGHFRPRLAGTGQVDEERQDRMRMRRQRQLDLPGCTQLPVSRDELRKNIADQRQELTSVLFAEPF